MNSRESATEFAWKSSLRQALAVGEQKESHLWADKNIWGPVVYLMEMTSPGQMSAP